MLNVNKHYHEHAHGESSTSDSIIKKLIKIMFSTNLIGSNFWIMFRANWGQQQRCKLKCYRRAIGKSRRLKTATFFSCNWINLETISFHLMWLILAFAFFTPRPPASCAIVFKTHFNELQLKPFQVFSSWVSWLRMPRWRSSCSVFDRWYRAIKSLLDYSQDCF